MKITIKFPTMLFLLIIYSTSLSAQTTETYSLKWSIDHGWNVSDVCFSPDGKKVLAIESNASANSVKLLDAFTGQILWSKNASARFGKFSPDGTKIYIAGSSTLALNTFDGTQLWFNNQSADCMDLNANGSIIALGWEIDRGHGKVVVINASDGTKLWEGATNGPVNSIKFSPDGSRVVSGGGDLYEKEAILWNSLSGAKLWTFLSSQVIQTVSYSPDGAAIIVGTYWKDVTLLNASTGTIRWTYTFTERFLDSGFTPDGKKVFLSSTNGYVRMFDVENGTLLMEKVIGNGSLKSIKNSPDGSRLAVGSEDKYINILDLSSNLLFKGLHNYVVNVVNYSYDGTRIVTGTYGAGKVSVWQKDGTVDLTGTGEVVPKHYYVSQNYPNPFNPTTVISYQLPVSGHVSLNVYDILGNEIVSLIEKEHQAGYYNVTLNAKRLSSGIYFYRFEANGYSSTKKIILLR